MIKKIITKHENGEEVELSCSSADMMVEDFWKDCQFTEFSCPAALRPHSPHFSIRGLLDGVSYDSIGVDSRRLPDKIFVNYKKKTDKTYTTVLWNDKTTTIVMKDGKKSDIEQAVLYAFFEKYSGLTKTKRGKYFDKLRKEYGDTK